MSVVRNIALVTIEHCSVGANLVSPYGNVTCSNKYGGSTQTSIDEFIRADEFIRTVKEQSQLFLYWDKPATASHTAASPLSQDLQ